VANTRLDPWSPDPDVDAGTPPVDGDGGERGTSAFPGNSRYNHDGTRKASGLAPGPKTGASYYTGGVSPVTEGRAASGAREAAGTHDPFDELTVAVVPSTATPAANASVTFTATITPSGDYPATGNVAFKEGATTLGTDTSIVNNVASYAHAAGFAAGAHSITAVYSGDENYDPKTSPAVVVTAS
jgi:hypothetical protein